MSKRERDINGERDTLGRDALADADPVILDRVMCQWCGRGHDGSALGPTQSLGCSASVFIGSERYAEGTDDAVKVGEWYVQGHYPSDFDTDLYRFVKNAPIAAADPVCDVCIRERIAAGDIEQIEGHWL